MPNCYHLKLEVAANLFGSMLTTTGFGVAVRRHWTAVVAADDD